MCVSVATGQHAAMQQLSLEVKPVARLSVDADPLPLVVTAGTGAAADGNGRYSLVTNILSMRITAALDRPMPSGTSLAIQLESTTGVSRGEVDITRAAGSNDVVTGIRPGIETHQRITYRFSAEPGIAEVASGSRTVTLTLTD